MLEWFAISSSRWSSLPRDWTQISCIAGGFYTVEPLGKLIYIMVTYKMYFQLTAKKSNLYKLIRPNACMLNRFGRVQLWDPMAVTCRTVFSVHGLLQARILELVAMPSFRESSPSRYGTHSSCRFFTAEPPKKLCPNGSSQVNLITWNYIPLFLQVIFSPQY